MKQAGFRLRCADEATGPGRRMDRRGHAAMQTAVLAHVDMSAVIDGVLELALSPI